MDVLLVLAVVGGLAAVVYAFTWTIETVNGYSMQTFGYQPIALERVLMISPAWIFIMVALFAESPSNIVVASAVATLIGIAVAWHVADHTSAPVAIVSTVLLLTLGLLVVILFFALLGEGCEDKGKR